MNITIIGSGYVGLVSGTCFAEMGNRVTCVDIDPVKIEKLNKGIIPIFEPGLETMLLNNVKNESLFFTTELNEALQNSEIAFIAVGTPMGDDGSADLKYVLQVAQSIGEHMQHHLVVVETYGLQAFLLQTLQQLQVNQEELMVAWLEDLTVLHQTN